MKFIHTSDWHIGRSLCGVSLLEDQRHFLRQFSEYLAEEQPDAVAIAGDLYDRPIPSADALELLDDFFSKTVLEQNIPVLAIAGNHDSGQRLSYERSFLARAGLHIAGELSDPAESVILQDEWGPVRFYLLPWLDPAAVNSLDPDRDRVRTAQEAFDRMAETIRKTACENERKVLVCHGYFCATDSEREGALGGSELVSLAAFSDFSYVAAGHIHRRVPLSSRMRYSGSILKYSPNELSNSPSVAEITLDKDGAPSIREVRFPPLRDMRKVAGKFSELLEGPSSDDYIFAELADTELVLDPARRLKERFPNLLGVSYQEREQQASAFTVSAEQAHNQSIEELFSQFYQEVTGFPLPASAEEPVAEAARTVKKEATT